ncbi:acylphosphatase [Mesotoga prima]|uniref:acylphosphatase n=1 Tax=Mesotoga prima TaxID=1184387 RepID=UPI002C2B1FC9|nr:acylphosphatase [Mesotoga prima]HQC14031.1 acylphosphatase [Mesotoga prima]
MRTVEIIIQGRVQKVGMRNFIRRLATRHEITGYVENLDDGSVRVVAQGSKAQLNAFLAKIEKGSISIKLSGGNIERVTERPSMEHGFMGFEKR